MKWTKATDKYPEQVQLARVIGTCNNFPAMFATHVIADFTGKTYRKDQIEWLDPASNDPVFSLGDMKNAFDSGKHAGEMETLFHNTDQISLEQISRVTRSFDVFMDNEYKINVS